MRWNINFEKNKKERERIYEMQNLMMKVLGCEIKNLICCKMMHEHMENAHFLSEFF